MARVPNRKGKAQRRLPKGHLVKAAKLPPLSETQSLDVDCITCSHRRVCEYKYKYSQWKERIYPVKVECEIREGN